MTPSVRRRIDRQLRLDMLEAAVRENEVELGRKGPELDDRDSRKRLRRRRFSPWSLLLLAPATAVVGFGYLELRTDAASRSRPDAPTAPSEPDIRFTELPESLDLGVFPLPVRRIVLDPGHGGSASGTVADGLTEKELALDIALRLRALLSDRFRVALTREADINVELDRRSDLANRAAADLFVSIHVNWLPQNRTCGIETYYLGPAADPELAELAERENAEAHGYSLADLRSLLDGVYARTMQDESRSLAVAVQRALVERLRRSNPELRNRGVKTAPFVVLVNAEMPAILAEVSCLSDAGEIERMRDDRHLQSIAEALDAGIRSYADSLLRPAEPPGEEAVVSVPSERQAEQ